MTDEPVVPQPPNPPQDAHEAFDAWVAQRGVKGDPLLETVTNLAFFAGWGARGERVTPEPAADDPKMTKFVHRANDGEQSMAAALKPFGWICSEEFWRRYYTDPWVFNLANAVERLSARVRPASQENAT